jgi:hypothetical protein
MALSSSVGPALTFQRRDGQAFVNDDFTRATTRLKTSRAHWSGDFHMATDIALGRKPELVSLASVKGPGFCHDLGTTSVGW